MVLGQKIRAKNPLLIAGVLLTAACLCLLPFTMARTAWLGVMAGVLVVTEYRYGWFVKTFGRMKRRIRIGAMAAGTIILVIAGVALYQLKPDSAQGRLLIWKVAADIFGDHPLAGAGFQTFAREYNLHQAAYFASDNGSETEQWLAGCNRLSFNDYLQTAAETGAVGLFLMLSVGGVLVYYRKQMRTPYTQGAMGSLASLACCACFSYPFHEIAIIVLAGLLLLVAGSGIKPLPWTLSVWLQRITVIAVLVMAGVLCYHSVVRLQSVRRWKNVVSGTTVRGFDTTRTKYLPLYPRLEDNPYFLYNYGVELLLSGDYGQSIPVLLQTSRYFTDTDVACCLGDAYKGTGQYSDAEKAYRLAANMAPNKFYPLYCLAKLYRETCDGAKAIDMANAIVDKKEKVKSYTTYKIKTEMKQMIDSLRIEY